MANKKIQLNYLWTDESVMQADFAKSVSAGMTKWANEFYATYEFQLDVQPNAAKPTVASTAKFALKKNNGVRPDLNLKIWLLENFQEMRKPFVNQILEKTKEIAAKSEAIASKWAEVSRKLIEFNILDSQPLTNALLQQKTALVARITTLQQEAEALRAQRDVLDAAVKKAESDLEALERKLDSDIAKGDYETELRRQMTALFLAQKIGDEKRLNVVFCQFLRREMAMRGRMRLGTTGETFHQIDARIPALGPMDLPRILREFLWPYPFIIVDIAQADPWTVAHEVVHAAGYDHPDAVKLVVALEKRIRGLKPGPGGSILRAELDVEEVPIYRTVPGGFYDGAANDIMNYTQEGSRPSDFILSDAHKKLLEQAPFVVP